MRRLHNENAFMYHPSIDKDERKPARPTVEFYVSDGVLYEKTVFDNLLDFVFVDMLRGMVVGHFPKRCANCHRWFLQEDSYRYEYCGKPSPQNPSLTCREIGAQESFLNKVKMNPVWKAYQRGYKKYYARVLKKTWTKAQFLEWQERALELREKALSGELSAEDFTQMINEK